MRRARKSTMRCQNRVMYIEQKTDGNANLQHRGPAVIVEVSFSKSGSTITYRGKSFQRIKRGGIYGNYRCLEDGNEYWISGVKKEHTNRHRFGGGPVTVEVPDDQLNSFVSRRPRRLER